MSIQPVYFEGNLGRQDREKLIFVEGTDDAYFIDAILEDLGANPDEVGVVIVGGIPRFGSSISIYSKSSAFRKARGVAVLRDADNDPGTAVKELEDAFQKSFKVKVDHGKLVTSKNVVYGIFVLPSAAEQGDLERMCLDTVAGTHLHKIAENYINLAKEAGPLSQVHKRTAQVFLAAVPDELCRGAGMGFRRGYFDLSHDSLEPLKGFLKDFISA